ncbi:unnamed protein product [Gemmata massiliana]|uniref:Uncharacterized protein n=1 Tax=Gemmata massiliana TaxID=1210884 RepID=A0A6P2D6R4_9BACT|nr:TIGR02996 domain-containing protein [Gemmata massiliana]VTR96145.1 unnamed protein product [Gemmata massiliana]
MDERAALFTNVLNDPTDDTARLVLADWLDENNENAFARFLRAGVVASQLRDEALIDDPEYDAALTDLVAVATSGLPALFLARLGIGRPPPMPEDWVWDNTGDRVTVRIGGVAGVFTRGLLSELVAPLGHWGQFAPVACGACRSKPGPLPTFRGYSSTSSSRARNSPCGACRPG